MTRISEMLAAWIAPAALSSFEEDAHCIPLEWLEYEIISPKLIRFPKPTPSYRIIFADEHRAPWLIDHLDQLSKARCEIVLDLVRRGGAKRTDTERMSLLRKLAQQRGPSST